MPDAPIPADAAIARLREVLGDRAPNLTDADRRRTDELLAKADRDAQRVYDERHIKDDSGEQAA